MLKYNTKFLNNSIYFIDCLAENDFHTARRLYEDVAPFACSTAAPRINYLKAETKQSLLNLLSQIEQECREGVKPILHFEAHGDRYGGFEIGNEKEKLEWGELIKSLRAINIATRNNTGVVMAACSGLYAIKPVSIYEPTPFFFLIGSESKLYAGELEGQLRSFYENLIRGDSLNTAISYVSEKFKCYHSEKYFLIAMGRYFRHQCMGKGKDARVERLITEINNKPGHNRSELRRLRKQIKQGIKPSPDVYYKYGQHFLHGQLTAKYPEFIAFIRRERLPET